MISPELPRVWRCPECGVEFELDEPAIINRHHDWHRLAERQRAESERDKRDR